MFVDLLLTIPLNLYTPIVGNPWDLSYQYGHGEASSLPSLNFRKGQGACTILVLLIAGAALFWFQVFSCGSKRHKFWEPLIGTEACNERHTVTEGAR
jgi:hypothetical protein